MVTAVKDYDVFISHVAADSKLANEVNVALENVGLHGFHHGSIKPGENLSEAIWQALAETQSMVLIISPETPLESMNLVELGAATAWNKSVYVLVDGPPTTRIPELLSARHYAAYPKERLEDVIQEIKSRRQRLEDIDVELLKQLYSEQEYSTDQLVTHPAALRKLTEKFHIKSRKQLSGEQLLSHLMRLRKGGRLPKVKSKKASAI